MKLQLLCAIVALNPVLASAEEPGQVCTALLEHGIKNVIDYSSEYDYLSVLKDDYCSSSFSSLSKSRQDGFELSIKKLPLKYSGGSSKASEQHAHFCREYGNLQSGSGQSRYSASTLYDKAIDAWRDCVNLAIGGTQIKPSVTPDLKIVDVNLSVTRGAATFTGVETTNMQCTMDGESVGPNVSIPLTSEARSLRCSRKSTPLQFNSDTVQFFPQANVKVKASTGDFRVDLYEMIDGPANDRISRLEAEIASLRSFATTTTTDLAALGGARDGQTFVVNNPRMGNKGAKCPAGTFISSVVATKGVGGKYGVDGISELTVRCSPLRK